MHFIIDLKVFPFQTLFSFGETNEQIHKALKKYKINLDDSTHEMIDNSFGKNNAIILPGGQTIIRLACVPSNSGEYALLSHEIFHIACFILDRIGVKFSEDSEEVFAYVIQYLTQESLQKIFKYDRANNNS